VTSVRHNQVNRCGTFAGHIGGSQKNSMVRRSIQWFAEAFNGSQKNSKPCRGFQNSSSTPDMTYECQATTHLNISY